MKLRHIAFLAFALAGPAPANPATPSPSLEPLCGEIVATVLLDGRPWDLVYDCSGERGEWVVVPAETIERVDGCG